MGNRDTEARRAAWEAGCAAAPLGVELEASRRAVRVLNEALAADPSVAKLFKQRVCINQALADHPTIQVSSEGGVTTVGVLGLINGLFGIRSDGYGHITAVVDEKTGEIQRFEETHTWKYGSD